MEVHIKNMVRKRCIKAVSSILTVNHQTGHFIVMTISTFGVAQSLLKKISFQCACPGTIIKLQLGKANSLENLLITVMSLFLVIKLL